jgi:steroid 5-alpha reductase family enzyme
MWWAIYVFSIAASGVWLNWSIAGAILLTLLFQGSTRFTEELTLSKYPAYRDYQQTTSRLIPWLPETATKHEA